MNMCTKPCDCCRGGIFILLSGSVSGMINILALKALRLKSAPLYVI